MIDVERAAEEIIDEIEKHPLAKLGIEPLYALEIFFASKRRSANEDHQDMLEEAAEKFVSKYYPNKLAIEQIKNPEQWQIFASIAVRLSHLPLTRAHIHLWLTDHRDKLFADDALTLNDPNLRISKRFNDPEYDDKDSEFIAENVLDKNEEAIVTLKAAISYLDYMRASERHLQFFELYLNITQLIRVYDSIESINRSSNTRTSG